MSIGNITEIKNKCKIYINAHALTEVNKHGTLLYVCLSGSLLHGTITPTSDLDIKGIYLPYKNNLLNGKHTPTINIKGVSYDGLPVDFEVWSLQYLKHLVKSGDSNIIDTLFSQTYTDAILYADDRYLKTFNLIFIKEHILFNNMTGIVGYCLDQAEKYNVKISTLKTLKEILEIVEEFPCTEDTKFSTVFSKLPQKSHVYITDINGCIFYNVFGKSYQNTIKLQAFKNAIQNRISAYGKRSHEAFNNNSADWKSLAHAYRAGLEYYEILTTGKITFPLKECNELLNIKLGNSDFEKTKLKIEEIIDKITELDNGKVFNRNEPDFEYLHNIVLGFYKYYNQYPTNEYEQKLELI